MSTYYRLSGQTAYHIAAARVTYEKSDGSIGELNMAGGGSTDWADITNKPATYPPIVGLGANQAKPGNWACAWGDIIEKPAVIATGSTQAAARTSILAAASGANSDITSLTALSTPLSAAQGGTGVATLALLASGLNIEAFLPGIAPTISNLDSWVAGGIRSLTTSTTGRPTGTVAGDLVMNIVSATRAAQIAFLTGTNNLAYRTYNGSAWGAWQNVTKTAL